MPDGLVEEIPHESDLPHPLGRSIINHDPQNRVWSIRPLLQLSPEQDRPWYARHKFNQQGSSCTTQAATGLLMSSPFRLNKERLSIVKQHLDTEAKRHQFYLDSQAYDPWEGGELAYEGTSSDAPYRLMRERGIISQWRWCFGVDDINLTLRRYSPVTVGTYWHDSMFQVDKSGFLVVDRNSSIVGGHEWLVLEYDDSDDWYTMLNSWGELWGRKGRARVKGDDFRYLIENNGDATTVVL